MKINISSDICDLILYNPAWAEWVFVPLRQRALLDLKTWTKQTECVISTAIVDTATVGEKLKEPHCGSSS